MADGGVDSESAGRLGVTVTPDTCCDDSDGTIDDFGGGLGGGVDFSTPPTSVPPLLLPSGATKDACGSNEDRGGATIDSREVGGGLDGGVEFSTSSASAPLLKMPNGATTDERDCGPAKGSDNIEVSSRSPPPPPPQALLMEDTMELRVHSDVTLRLSFDRGTVTSSSGSEPSDAYAALSLSPSQPSLPWMPAASMSSIEISASSPPPLRQSPPRTSLLQLLRLSRIDATREGIAEERIAEWRTPIPSELSSVEGRCFVETRLPLARSIATAFIRRDCDFCLQK